METSGDLSKNGDDLDETLKSDSETLTSVSGEKEVEP